MSKKLQLHHEIWLVGPQAKPAFLKKTLPPAKKNPWIIAVDGGLDVLAKIGRLPDLAVGDWDSLKKKSLLNKVDHITLPHQKDASDLAYALRLVEGLYVSAVRGIGFSGGRLDHELSNIFELAQFAARYREPEIQVLTESEHFYFVSSKLSLKSKPGSLLSCFSVGAKEARGVTLQGVEYALKKATLPPSSLGLSNVVKKARCQVSVTQGVLLVVHHR